MTVLIDQMHGNDFSFILKLVQKIYTISLQNKLWIKRKKNSWLNVFSQFFGKKKKYLEVVFTCDVGELL
jgi:hypothetical protein